jgi:hypothetical protein
MRRDRIILNVGVIAAAFAVFQIAAGQVTDPPVLSRDVQGENRREITAPSSQDALPNSSQAPAIGFIDSPSALCYQPDTRQNVCYLNWYYLSVSASPNYMISMTLALNNVGTVANVAGFFQTSMYVPYNMLGQGFKVVCGSPGAGGDASMGNSYAYTIRARDSSNLSSANYGTVYCPAYRP